MSNFYTKYVDEGISVLATNYVEDMYKEGLDSSIASKLFYIQVVKEKIRDLNIEDMPSVIDSLCTEFADNRLFKFEDINEATIDLCKIFSFPYEEDDSGEIIQGSIKYIEEDK